MTSLVFGLMINSAKNTYESIDAHVHIYSTNLIILDRTLRQYGLQGTGVRDLLIAYVSEAIVNPARATGEGADTAGQALERFGNALDALSPITAHHVAVLDDAKQQYREVVERRWAIVEQSEGTIPLPIIGMLIAWLTAIYASFGYRASKNVVVAVLFVVSALLLAGSFYLVLDMNIPFSGIIRISDAPLQRALLEMQSRI